MPSQQLGLRCSTSRPNRPTLVQQRMDEKLWKFWCLARNIHRVAPYARAATRRIPGRASSQSEAANVQSIVHSQAGSQGKRRGELRRRRQSCDMSTAAIAARRALQQQRARVLYRRALRNVLSYAVHRDIFYVEAQKMREQFEINKDVANLETIDRLLYEGETRVEKFQHPDPYIVPWAPGGSKWARNPPVPEEIGVVLNFGREENH